MVAFDIYLLYASIGMVCAMVIGIILNRVKSTAHKDTIDFRFCMILRFFIVFCAVDCLWGFIGSPLVMTWRPAYVVATYSFHVMAAVSAFMCGYYGSYYLKLTGKLKTAASAYRKTLILIQILFLFQNTVTGILFSIDADSVYHSTKLRYVTFYLQFCQYIPLMIYALYKFLRKPKGERYLFSSLIIFFGIAVLFGILQMFFPDGAFYSLGFMVVSVAIYAFNVTAQREKFITEAIANAEREKSRSQIEKALETAKAANAAKTVFLANMSHDIRTPINAIMGMVMIAKQEQQTPKSAECLRKIDNTSHHLLSLVNDVLDISRIESGKTVIGKESVNLQTLVDACRSIILGQLESRDIRFEVSTEHLKHSHVLGDPLHLRQVFINILSNAVKFTPDGGEILFEASELKSTDDKAVVSFIIKDTGVGMKPDFVPHVFEAFTQENANSRSNYQGTGLGMAITKQLTDLMGGTISVESTYGVGSTFTVVFTFAIDREERLINVDQRLDDIVFDGMRVLLAEDNELNVEIATFLLEGRGIKVTAVGNGKLAVDTFAINPPGTFDLILMDIMMPEMNGYEATRAIRALPREDAANIPIIAMTANAFDEDRRNAFDAGMNGHIAKPLDTIRMFRTIGNIVGTNERK